ncbi:MAG: type II toxin-antitoxin system RelE/ParE family toxin, partial [Dehalococcoidia bacterium]
LIERIMRLADNPRPAGSKKLAGETHYRIRQGNYRVIYGVDDRQRMVDIIRVGHRREVYR